MIAKATAVLVELLLAGKLSGFYVAHGKHDADQTNKNNIKLDFGKLMPDGDQVGREIIVDLTEEERDLEPEIRQLVDEINE